MLLPLALTVLAQLELHLPHSTESAPATVPHSLLLLVATAPLALQRRFPLAAPALAAAAWAVEPLCFPVANTFAVPLSVLGLAPLATTRWAAGPRRALLGSAVVLALLVLEGVGNEEFGLGGAVANGVFGAVAACAGQAWRRTSTQRRLAEERVQLERAAREDADRALGAERTRMARELHDVLGHGLSVVLLQARGARRVLGNDPAAARTALDEVERAAASSLREVRLLMDVLRLPTGEPGPQPGLEDVPALVEGVRRTGTAVALRLPQPLPQLPAALGVSCYRVVQEGLTNALRHAPGAAVAVEVTRCGARLVLQVDTGSEPGTGPGAGPGAGPGGGHGLRGLGERAGLLGGELSAGPLPGGGHRLSVSLPLVDEAAVQPPPAGVPREDREPVRTRAAAGPGSLRGDVLP